MVSSSGVEKPLFFPAVAMSTPPASLRPDPPRSLSSYGLVKPRRPSRLLPWLLLALVWAAAAALLVLGTEAAPLVAALAG